MKQRAFQVIHVQLPHVHTTLQPPEKAHSCVKAVLPQPALSLQHFLLTLFLHVSNY